MDKTDIEDAVICKSKSSSDTERLSIRNSKEIQPRRIVVRVKRRRSRSPAEALLLSENVSQVKRSKTGIISYKILFLTWLLHYKFLLIILGEMRLYLCIIDVAAKTKGEDTNDKDVKLKIFRFTATLSGEKNEENAEGKMSNCNRKVGE